MAVTAQTPFSQFTAAPGATVFSSEFRVLQASDLVVKVNGAVITGGFTVTGIGAAGGVDVTFSTPMTGGEVVELLRDVPLARAIDYQQLGDFLSPVVNLDFDRVWMALQGLGSRVFGSLRAPYPEQIGELPNAATRAGNFMAFDAEGRLILTVPVGGNAESVLLRLIGAGGAGQVGTTDGRTVQQRLDAMVSEVGDVLTVEIDAAVTAAESARDAALIQAGVYTTLEAGLADVSIGESFKVQGSGEVAAVEYRKVTSTNIYNPANKRNGFFLNSGAGGAVVATAGWGVTEFIPVTPGNAYTISFATRRVGVTFFTSASDSAVVAGSYNGSASKPLTVTAPAGAAFMVVALYSPTVAESNVQIEPGATASAYMPFGVVGMQIASYPASAAVVALKDRADQLDDDVFTTEPAKNLANPAIKVSGRYVGSAGTINSDVAWSHSGYIPVVSGETYSISWTGTKRQGLAFTAASGDLTYIAGSYNGSSSNPLTVTAPVGANFLVVNLKSDVIAEPATFQVERGPATDYVAWRGPYLRVRADAIEGNIVQAAASGGRLSLVSGSSPGSSFVESVVDGDTVRWLITPNPAATHDQSGVFNFHSLQVQGASIKAAGDDAAPYRVLGTTIGANHGYSKTRCTVTGHGKTYADVGSVWSNGGVQWVIVDVPNVNTLDVTARTSNDAFGGGTLTHVSGATNAASFTPSGVAADQWFPVIKNRALSVAVDGVPLADVSADLRFSDHVAFTESYEIMGKSAIVEWLITQVGTATDIASYNAAADLSVSIVYRFDAAGGCAIHTDFLALNAVSNFQDIMFTQAGAFTAGVNGAVRYYVPKALPLTHESVSYDFARIVDMTGWAPASRLNFTTSNTVATGQLADRLVMLNDGHGMALGYLPLQSASPAVRRTNASRKALQISESAKVYPSCIDRADKTSLAAGEFFSAVFYRSVFKRNAARTGAYVVRSGRGDYLYADWHTTTVDRVTLPPDLAGRAFSVEEKSANVSILSEAASGSVVFSVAAAGAYGYAVLKFEG